MSNNGQALTPHLPVTTPILGEPVVEGATLVVSVKCPCQQHTTILSQFVHGQWRSMPGACPQCFTPYAIQRLGLDARGGLHIELAKGARPAGDESG
jgi:hypothetical protein